jgi:long-chain fatty acid transport protein
MKVEDGNATFEVPASVSSRFPTGTTFNAELPLPSTLSLGIGFMPTEALTIAVDVSRVGWSAYEKLRFDYSENVNGSKFTENARNYEDAYIYRIGAEYQLNEKMALRGGAYLDQTPVQDGYLTPETPDADSRGLSAGIGYRINDKINVDASFLYINKKERTDTGALAGGIAGTFKSVAYIPGLALTYNF